MCPDQDYIERAYDDAKYGRPSADPVLECTMASAVDPSVAPPGKHLMSMFIQYAPYKLKEGDWDAIKDTFADRCFDILEQYAPGFKSSVIARQVVTPLDLERTFALTGGNIFQGAMTLNQLFLIHRYKIDSVHYLTPTDDNHRQTDKMRARGIFTAVNDEVGEIIVADVNKDLLKQLVDADRAALTALITQG